MVLTADLWQAPRHSSPPAFPLTLRTFAAQALCKHTVITTTAIGDLLYFYFRFSASSPRAWQSLCD